MPAVVPQCVLAAVDGKRHPPSLIVPPLEGTTSLRTVLKSRLSFLFFSPSLKFLTIRLESLATTGIILIRTCLTSTRLGSLSFGCRCALGEGVALHQPWSGITFNTPYYLFDRHSGHSDTSVDTQTECPARARENRTDLLLRLRLLA